jgi:hypothetical protein
MMLLSCLNHSSSHGDDNFGHTKAQLPSRERKNDALSFESDPKNLLKLAREQHTNVLCVLDLVLARLSRGSGALVPIADDMSSAIPSTCSPPSITILRDRLAPVKRKAIAENVLYFRSINAILFETILQGSWKERRERLRACMYKSAEVFMG